MVISQQTLLHMQSPFSQAYNLCKWTNAHSRWKNLQIDIPSTWDVIINLGTICQTAKMIISDSHNDSRFSGVMVLHSMKQNIAPIQIHGRLVGSEIQWTLGKLQYRGELSEDATTILNGLIAGNIHQQTKFLGMFAANRLQCFQRELHGSLWGSSLQISENMLDELDKHGASHRILQEWYSADKLLTTTTEHMCTKFPPMIRITMLRYLFQFLDRYKKENLWYAVVSQTDRVSYQLLNSGYFLHQLPLTFAAIMRLVLTRDAACKKIPIIEYLKCASTIEQYLYNAGHVDITPQERTVSDFIYEEKKLFLDIGASLSFHPSASDWLSVLFTRLAVLTEYKYITFLECAWYRCNAFVAMITLILHTLHSKFPSERIARGLFVHSLIAVRLLPFELLRPCFMDNIDWEKLFIESQPEKLQAAMPCLLVTDCISTLMQQMQVAASSCLLSLIEDSYYIAALMRHAFPALRRWNSAKKISVCSSYILSKVLH